MAGVKVLPEVRIFSDLAQDIAERRIDLPMQSDELFHHRPRGPGGNVAIGRQPFKGISEIDNVLFAGAPVVRAKMVIANKGERWAGRSLIPPASPHPGADAGRGYYR